MRKRFGGFLIVVGLLLILSAVGLIGYNSWDNNRVSKEMDSVLEQIRDFRDINNVTGDDFPTDTSSDTVIPYYMLDPDMEMPTVEINGYDYIGTLTIPVLDLELPVMDTWSYPQLKISPCRYSGTAYKKNFVIAAHNYNAHFGRLKDLRLGDQLTFTDIEGNVFNYDVCQIETLYPTEVEKMKSGGWDLTLFTCTVGGRTRVTIRCYLID